MEVIFDRKLPDPMTTLDAHEAALAAYLGVQEAPYHPPDANNYLSNYILDGCISAQLRTAFGYHAKAAKQLNSFRKNQRPDGSVPGVNHPPKRFSINPERWLSTEPFVGNDYTQSPDWARVVLYLHETASNKPPVNKE